MRLLDELNHCGQLSDTGIYDKSGKENNKDRAIHKNTGHHEKYSQLGAA